MRDKCFPIPPCGPGFYKPTGGEEATSLGAQMDFSLGHRMGLGHRSRPADQISHNWDSRRNLRARAISNFSSKSLQGSQFPQMFWSVSSNGCLEANILLQKQFLSTSELLFVCLCPCQSVCALRVCVCDAILQKVLAQACLNADQTRLPMLRYNSIQWQGFIAMGWRMERRAVNISYISRQNKSSFFSGIAPLWVDTTWNVSRFCWLTCFYLFHVSIWKRTLRKTLTEGRPLQ